MRTICAVLLGAVALAFSIGASAQDAFPSKPIKMLVVYPPGGGGDILARTLSEAVSKLAGQPMVVENRPGAGGMIGTAACKNAAADGYTYCMVLSDIVTINHHIFKKVPYDVDRDLRPVASIASVPVVVFVNKSNPANNMRDFAAYSRQNKGKVNWASWGMGTSAHIFMAHYNKAQDADFTHVPYQGVPQILNAVLSNEVDSSMVLYGPLAQYLEKGEIKPIGVLAEKRLKQLPNVPTVNEQGLNFSPTLWYGIFAPAATPNAIVERMNSIFNTAMADPAVAKFLDGQGFSPLPDSPKGFGERVKKDRDGWGPVAKSLNLALD